MSGLKVTDLSVTYGGVRAVRGVSLEVPDGSCVAILGANGAGKSSLLKAISGVAPSTGRVALDDIMLGGSPDRRARKGLGHVLEGRHVFTQLTVRENLEIGLSRRTRWGDATAGPVLDAFPVLRAKLDRRAGELSGGEQQTVAIGRALISRPSVLLMDEPSLGLSPNVIDQLMLAIDDLRKQWGTTLLIAEQSLPLAVGLAGYFYVLSSGRLVYEGFESIDVLWKEAHAAYLGVKADDRS